MSFSLVAENDFELPNDLRRRSWASKQKRLRIVFAPRDLMKPHASAEGNEKSHPRNQKSFHSRSGFGYGILLYIRKMPYFRPFTAHFGGFKGFFPYKIDESAILCPDKTEMADFVSFKGSIVQGINLCNK